MTKFEIEEVQIDSYNDTHNSLIKFDGGFNLICGENEAGKSTLMQFIKNIFIRKSDAKGYIKCKNGEESFNLRAEKKFKENEKYIGKIDALGYSTGFVIDLDDLMFAKIADTEALINIIKDSSGNAVNKKQEEYYDYIYGKKEKFTLRSKNLSSKDFEKQFNKLKELDAEIKELQTNEEKYNNICLNIEEINKEIDLLTAQKECAEIIQIKNISEKEKENTKLNKKILEYKTEFEKIREDFGALNLEKSKIENYRSEIEDKLKEIDLKIKELNKYELFEKEDIYNFDLSPDKLDLSKQIIEKLRTVQDEKNNTERSIEETNARIKELTTEVTSIEKQLNSFNIKDSDEYKKDREILESYKNTYAEFQNKVITTELNNPKKEKWYHDVYFILFLGMFFALLGSLLMYWNTDLKLILLALFLVTIVGILTSLMKKIELRNRLKDYGYSKNLKDCEIKIKEFCKKYGFTINNKDNFIVQIGALLQRMSDKLSEYKLVENDLLKVRISLEKDKEILKSKTKELEKAEKTYGKIIKEQEDFLKNCPIKNIKNYPEIYFIIKDIKRIYEDISIKETEQKTADKSLSDFVERLNNFIEKTEIENIQKLNIYDCNIFEDVLSNIRKVLDENISIEKVLDELNNKIEDCEKKLLNYSDNNSFSLSEITEKTIDEIDKNIQNKRDERAKLSQTKDDLEKVTTLVSLKNQKNKELSNIHSSIKKLIQKEIIYEIIKKSKEKYNETQPNIISAKKYLTEITNGKYSEIDFENKTISGDKVGQKEWGKLSRGTKEQLYLALRLGFANNYSKDLNGAPNGLPELPIIIDDAFVNFDSERTASVLKCLSEFSKNNQVLYFTCHSKQIKDLIKKDKPDVNIIDM